MAVIGVMLSAVGCSSYRNFEENIKSDIASVKQKQEVQEKLESKQESEQAGQKETTDDGEETLQPVVLDPSIFDESLGSVQYVVTKAQFYQNPEDIGIDESDTVNGFEEDEAFILMTVTAKNISDPGSSSDGSINVGGRLFLLDRTYENNPSVEANPDSETSPSAESCYLQEHGDGDDYWHIKIGIGEEKTLHFGFSVPVKNQEEAKKYLITWNATHEVSGEIPFVER